MPSPHWDVLFESEDDSLMKTLNILCFLGWVVAYKAAIYIGFKQKTYCFPIPVQALNMTWEAYYGFIATGSNNMPVGILFSILDFGIFLTICFYGHKYHKQTYPTKSSYFTYLFFIYTSAATWIVIFDYYVGCGQESDCGTIENGATYSAYVDNYLMDILFIYMYYSRNKLCKENSQLSNGQSWIIAVAKFVGTGASAIITSYIDGQRGVILLYMYIWCEICEIWYIIILLFPTFPHLIMKPIADCFEFVVALIAPPCIAKLEKIMDSSKKDDGQTITQTTNTSTPGNGDINGAQDV